MTKALFYFKIGVLFRYLSYYNTFKYKKTGNAYWSCLLSYCFKKRFCDIFDFKFNIYFTRAFRQICFYIDY